MWVTETDLVGTSWTFFTNQTHSLYCISEDPDTRTRHIADRVGIAQRGAHRIIAEPKEAGYLLHYTGRTGSRDDSRRVPLRVGGPQRWWGPGTAGTLSAARIDPLPAPLPRREWRLVLGVPAPSRTTRTCPRAATADQPSLATLWAGLS